MGGGSHNLSYVYIFTVPRPTQSMYNLSSQAHLSAGLPEIIVKAFQLLSLSHKLATLLKQDKHMYKYKYIVHVHLLTMDCKCVCVCVCVCCLLYTSDAADE